MSRNLGGPSTEIFCVCGKRNLYLFKVNIDNLQASERIKIHSKVTADIIEYKQVDEVHIVVLYEECVVIVNVSS